MSSTKRRRVAYSQNFLHNRKLVTQLVERSSIGRNDVVVEIGPGKGILTDVLAERSRHVITIEKDPAYAEQVSRRFGGRENVTVFACDILDFPLPETPFKVFANIPFRITTAIVDRLTTGLAPPIDAYLTVQAEAASRFVGHGEASMVSTCLKPFFELSVEHAFRRQDFVPQPSVDSVLLRIARRDEPKVSWDGRMRYRHLVEAVFSAWQPNVAQALRKLLPRLAYSIVREKLGPSLRVRPSQFPVDGWVEVFDVLETLNDDQVWSRLAAASGRLHRQQETLERPTRTRASHRTKRPHKARY